jgi:hypothetical protein
VWRKRAIFKYLLLEKTKMAALAARPWVVTTQAPIRPRASVFEICDGLDGILTGFLRVLRFSPVSSIPPVSHSHLYLNKTLMRNMVKPGDLPCCVRISKGRWTEEYFRTVDKAVFPWQYRLHIHNHRDPIGSSGRNMALFRHRNTFPETTTIGKKSRFISPLSKG